MQIARVIGTVVASRKEQAIEGLKLLLLEAAEPTGKPAGKAPAHVVAADAVGAGLGDLVLFAAGSSARQTTVTKDRPIDATVMAIVDLVEEQRDMVYRKDAD